MAGIHEYSDKAQQGVDSRLPGRGSDGRWILYFASSAESVGRYRSDDTRIRWPGIWRSPDPFSSSWHQRLVIASNKTSVHGAMSSLCISSPAVPRGLDGPMDLEQRRPLTGELQETCTPPETPESLRNSAPRFSVRVRGFRGRSQRTGLPGQSVSGQRNRTSDRCVTFMASVQPRISSVQLTTLEPMPCLS